MKSINRYLLSAVLVISQGISGFSQEIVPQTVEVSCTKTTNIIFPYTIKSVDRGSQDILVQKAVGVENILQLKAAKSHFQQTNLSVVTGDGEFHSFLVNYADDPVKLNHAILRVPEHDFNRKPVEGKTINERDIEDNIRLVRQLKPDFAGPKHKKYGVQLTLNGLYIQGDLYYMVLSLENRSTVSYDLDGLRFFVREKKQAKRTAIQEIELSPVCLVGEKGTVMAQHAHTVIAVLSKFTLPEKKEFVLEVQEFGGGRHLRLRTGNRHLIKATLIN